MPAKFSISSIFKAVDKFSTPVKRMEMASQRFASKTEAGFARVERYARRLNKPIDRLLGKFGRMAALVGGLSLGLAINAGANAIIDLDKNVSAAASKFQIFDRQSESFKKLRDKAIELGATTEFTSGQAAEAMNNMAASGFNLTQTLAGISTVLDLATASQSELATSALIAGKAMSAFGLKSENPKIMAKNLEMVSNVLNKLKSGKEFTSLEEILVTITGSGAAAKLAGQDITTWAAAVGSSIGPIGDASKVGTQLNMALTKLAKPTGEAKSLVKKLGIQVDDGTGNFRDLFDIINDLSKATSKMGSRQKAAALSTIFGARSYKVMSVLIDQGTKKLKDYRAEIQASQGLTEKMAKFMRQGLAGGIAIMKAAFESIAITIGDTFEPEIRRAVERVTVMAQNSRAWLDANKGLIKFIFRLVKILIKYALLVKGISLLIKVLKGVQIGYNIVLGIQAGLFGTLTKSIALNKAALISYMVATKAASIATAIFNAILAMNPIGLIVIGVMALIGAIMLLIKHWDKVKDRIDKMSNSVFRFGLNFINRIMKILEFISFMQDRIEGIKKAFSSGFVEGIKAIGKAIVSFMFKPVEVLLNAIGKIPGFKFANIGAQSIANFRTSLDSGLVSKSIQPEAATDVNLRKAERDNYVERYEEISRNKLGIELTNKTDKNVRVTDNPAMIPVLTNTQIPFRND